MGQLTIKRLIDGARDSFTRIGEGPSDHALIEQYANGNQQAFEILYRRHKEAVFAFLRRQCHNHAIAEELAHDTWLGVISQANNYQRTAAFKTWLYCIAHNRLVDYWRKHGDLTAAVFDELSDQVMASSDSSDGGLELDALVEQLQKLSPEQLAALLLKIEGFSYAEIADITDAKQETVKSRLRYATQNLRASMQATLRV